MSTPLSSPHSCYETDIYWYQDDQCETRISKLAVGLGVAVAILGMMVIILSVFLFRSQRTTCYRWVVVVVLHGVGGLACCRKSLALDQAQEGGPCVVLVGPGGRGRTFSLCREELVGVGDGPAGDDHLHSRSPAPGR